VDRHDEGQNGSEEALVQPDEAEDEVSSTDAVRTPLERPDRADPGALIQADEADGPDAVPTPSTARWRRWRARQIEQAGVDTFRQQQRARVRAWREQKTTPISVP
jgi:hypothetical protein